MKFFKTCICALASMVCVSGAANAATIDFTEAQFTSGFLSATNEYQSLGVLFTDFSFYDDTNNDFDPGDGRGIFNGFFDGNAIEEMFGRIDFIGGTTAVSVDWVSFIPNTEFGLAAFDSSDNLLDVSVGNTMSDQTGMLAIANPMIAYVIFGGTANSEPVGITTLSFTDPVPVPGALLLFATGIAGFGVAQRRRHKA